MFSIIKLTHIFKENVKKFKLKAYLVVFIL